MNAELSIGLVVLLGIIALCMAIAWAAQKGGPMMGPVSVIVLSIAVILIKLAHG